MTCYLKNLKYGFCKFAFRDELIRKREEEEEIQDLKRLGIYVEDLWIIDDIDEDGNVVEDDKYEKDEKNSYIVDETKSYEDKVRERKTGPSFDKDLNEKIDTQKTGSAFEK